MTAPDNALTYRVRIDIDAKTFKDFAVFDVFVRLRRWVPMAVFAGILAVSAVVCFSMRSRADNAVLLGVVLLVVGLGLPLVYVRQFFSSVKQQSKRMGLSSPRHVYTLSFSSQPDGITVEASNAKQPETISWDGVFKVYRGKNAIYLYVQSTKAYILPFVCVGYNAESLWALFTEMLPPEKLNSI